MRTLQTCVDCGKPSPETETDYTLISAKFGWRLTRWRTPEGTYGVEWRCPGCFSKHKKAKGAITVSIETTAPAERAAPTDRLPRTRR